MRVFCCIFTTVSLCIHRYSSRGSCNTSQAMCLPACASYSVEGSGSGDTCASSTSSHYDAIRLVACKFCALPENKHAALPPLPDGVLGSCHQYLSDIGVFVNAGRDTLGEASRAALAAVGYLPAANVIIASDAYDDNGDAQCKSAADAGVRVMLMPDDDDGMHSGGYGSSAPWKKAQSRFPHALAAAVVHMPIDVKWIISQDSDTALNLPAIAAILASQDPRSKVIFGCVYEHVRLPVRKSHHGGGAGMIFSRAAAELIVEAWRANLPYSAPRFPFQSLRRAYEVILCAGARVSTCGQRLRPEILGSSFST